MGFYQNFIKKCEEKNVSPSRAAQDVGLSNAAASGWKNGKEPNDLTLQKLATYFECDVADLTRKSYVSAGGKAHWKGNGVEVSVPEMEEPINWDDVDNDLVEYEKELNIMKEMPESRGMLATYASLGPEGARIMRNFMESVKNGEYDAST